jgi:hypothetical protein
VSNQLGYEYTMPDEGDPDFFTEFIVDVDKKVNRIPHLIVAG